MTNAILIHETGGPEVMRWGPVDVGDPGYGEVRVRHSAIGLNFIDVYHRSGLYPLASLPAVIGMEGAGIVEALGDGVANLNLGQRVAYASPPPGAYAEARLMPADRLVAVPDSITDQQAAAMMLQGMTAHYLLRRTYPVRPGDTILIHAAAGGVGLIVCQWAKSLGATVIGTVGSEEKAALASDNGCDFPILYRRESVTDRVRDITGGDGVPVVYDSIGKDTFEASLDCLRPLGMMVSFGNASGPVPPVRTGHSVGQGVSVFHPPDPHDLHRQIRGPSGRRSRTFSRCRERRRQNFGQPNVPAQGRRTGTHRSRSPEDNGVHHSDPMTRRPKSNV